LTYTLDHRHAGPGDVVVLDNLSVRKSVHVRSLIEHTGARLLLLLPYSPDFKSIDMAISKVKSVMKPHARRSADGLLQRGARDRSENGGNTACGFAG